MFFGACDIYAQDSRFISYAAIANRYTNEDIGVQYGGIDVLYGKVKRVIDMRFSKNLLSKILKMDRLRGDTINYDLKGNFKNKYLGPVSGNIKPSHETYFDQYAMNRDRPEAASDTVGQMLVDMFSASGDKVGEKYVFKDTSLNYTKRFEFAFGRNLNNYMIYNSKRSIEFKESYKYKNDSLLSEADDYDSSGKIERRIVFAYNAFDKKGNWTKRTETWKLGTGKIEKIVITYRKITYY